jgi:hypothetical protein
MTEALSGVPNKILHAPSEENLGENCGWWNVSNHFGCGFPKAEIEGRSSCEGMVDTVCLHILMRKGPPNNLTPEQILKLKTRIPGFKSNFNIPPGDIV